MNQEFKNAHESVASASALVESTAASVHRAVRLDQDATAKVTSLEQAIEATATQRGADLAALIATGAPSTVLPANENEEGSAAELAAAKAQATITRNALRSLEKAHAQAVADLEDAQSVLQRLTVGILEADAEALVREIRKHMQMAFKGRIRLLGLQHANVRGLQFSNDVHVALNPIFGDIPLELGHTIGFQGGLPIDAERRKWEARFAQLIAGNVADSEKETAAA